MCVEFNFFGRSIVVAWGGDSIHQLCAAAVLAGMCVSVPSIGRAGEPTADTLQESSVLVATREADVDEHPQPFPSHRDDDDGTLEPISQISEHSPELADQASADATSSETNSESDDQFGGALADASKPRKLSAQPAKFNGIQPGKSTKKDVLAGWKEPDRTKSTQGGSVLVYKTKPFRSVEVQLSGDLVTAIKIELQGTLSPKRLAKQLSLDKFDPVAVTDDQGATLGQIYPKRGVLFLFAPSSDAITATAIPTRAAVTHVVIQPLDADAFALRAESRLHGPYEKNIEDLETALVLNPDLAHAHWLLAEIYLATGQADLAMEAADEACEIDPENAAYQLRRAQAERALGRYDDATLGVRDVLDRASTPPIVQAQALHEMAKLATLGDAEISSKAISFDNRAITLADSLATSKNIKERRAAKELLIEAHLAIAKQIAGNAFSNKLESVSQWVGRASGLAEDMIAHDGGSVELRLLVARESLAALASLKPTKDPGPWIGEAEQASATLTEQCDDELWRRQIQWELGQAYFQAVRIEHLRLQPESALRYGQLAIENLADGATKRQSTYESEQLVGKLYFHIGVVHAVEKQDHKTAAQWYDKALPLLTSPRPASELLAPQHDGEELVSMAVSYWQIGEKDHAIDLTLNGIDLAEQAVKSGLLPEKSLAVPYGNLSAMYQQLGSAEDAAKYASLAKNAGGTPTPTAAPNTRTATSRRAPTMTAGQKRMRPPTVAEHSAPSKWTPSPAPRTAMQPNTTNMR
jgi:tetratricopeptide (TPR) repeat protein